VDKKILESCAEICIDLGSDGLRGELTLVRTARALAALRNSSSVDEAQLREIAPNGFKP
jgi:magnesium chelatase subunit I